MLCSPNQLTGFYMMPALAFNELTSIPSEIIRKPMISGGVEVINSLELA